MLIWKKPKLVVDLLLTQLDEAKKHALQGTTADENRSLSSVFDECKKELKRMGGVFPDMKSLEKTIMDKFCDLEQELYNEIFQDPKKPEIKETLSHMTDRIKKLREVVPSFDKSKMGAISFAKRSDMAMDDLIDDHQTVCKQWVDLKIENKLLESDAMSNFLRSFQCLSGSQKAKMCSLCLSVFPMNSIIVKRPLIYWWMGEALVTKSRDKTAEEVGEQVFQELLDEGFIRPSSENKSLSVKSFVIDPWVHRMLLLIAKGNFFEFSSEGTPCNGKRRAFLCKDNDASHSMRISGDQKEAEDLMMVFNLNEQYLRMKPEWLSKLRKVEVLQMGRWQNSVTYHIEVEDQTLFNALGSQKHLKYLSLRGISRIETLPASTSKLISLQILDLRACHNLEKLPPEVSKLKKLTHLDVSECYLLESMPKGLEHLASLQVLKGFVIGKVEKKSCKISDLTQLENLRKLSIRVGNGGETDQLLSLGNLPALSNLTISWGAASVSKGDSVSLPAKLTKLDLRCVPFEAVPNWLKPGTGMASKLVKLYIIGGKLQCLGPEIIKDWNVQFLRLKYLEDLKINEGDWEKYGYLDKPSFELDVDITPNRAS